MFHEHLTRQTTKTDVTRTKGATLCGDCLKRWQLGIVARVKAHACLIDGRLKDVLSPSMIGKRELLLSGQTDYMVQRARSIPCIVQVSPAIRATKESNPTTGDLDREGDTLSITYPQSSFVLGFSSFSRKTRRFLRRNDFNQTLIVLWLIYSVKSVGRIGRGSYFLQ